MKKALKIILVLLAVLVLGLGLGRFVSWVVGRDNFGKMNLGLETAAIVSVFVSMYIFVVLTAAVHEFGHLVCGLMSGYRFYSYRVLSINLCKYDDGFKIKRFAIPGTVGQCLMSPPKYNDGAYPIKLYLSGGNIATAFLFVIEMLIIVLVGLDCFIARLFVIGAVISLYFFIINAIPMKLSGVVNDGYNVKFLDKNPEQKKELWETLDVNAKTYKGALMSEVGIDFDAMDDEKALKEIASVGVQSKFGMKVNYLILMKRYEEAYSLCKKLLAEKEVVELYKYEIKCDKMFLEIVLGKDNKIKKTYSDELKAYINRTYKFMLLRKRLMYAYYLLIEKDLEKAAKEKANFDKSCAKAPDLGEVKSEKMIMEYIDLLYSERMQGEEMEA